MKKQIVSLLFCIVITAIAPLYAMEDERGTQEQTTAKSFLLKSPPAISEEEIKERVTELNLEMNWRYPDKKNPNKKSELGFGWKEGKTVMRIRCEEEFPQELGLYEKLFSLSTPEGKKIWTYIYGDSAMDKSRPSSKAHPSLEEAMGVVHPPRILENKTPKKVILSEIIKFIHNKHCVFYTGAGISAKVVPTMPELMESLQMAGENGKNVMDTLQYALKNPPSFVQPMDDFYNACLNGKPTKAHLAIRDIVQKKGWGLLTENLDLLHQRSGIDPLHHKGENWLKSNISEEDLQKIDYVLTIGLAKDESGFLGWYKANNPKGVIIAINLQKSTYLGEEDMLVIGDVQKLLPSLREELFLRYKR